MTFCQELVDLARLGIKISNPDLGTILHLLDLCGRCLPLGFLGSLCLIELELAIVHNLGNRGPSHRRDLHEVHIKRSRHGERLLDRLNA
jgi:hypothetical protein